MPSLVEEQSARPGSPLGRILKSPLRYVPFALALACLVAIVVTNQPPKNRPAATYYVQATGDDGNDGSSDKPWRTIQVAVDTAEPGSTVLIGSGRYDPFTVTRPDMTIAAQDRAEVIIRGDGNTRDVVLLAADNLTLSNVTIEGCVPDPAPAGFEANGSSGVRIDDGTDGVAIYRVTVRDGQGLAPSGQQIGCYGAVVHNARNATVANSRFYRNGYGVFVRGSQSVRVLNNTIYDNDVLIRNTATPDNDDYGAVGVGFDAVVGGLAQGNVIRDNGGPSNDYGIDGGAFEIFQSSGITMTENVLANNVTILETGTGPGGDCRDNSFMNNTATGRSAQSRLIVSSGILLRCALNMSITDNDLRGADQWMFYFTAGDAFAGSVADVAIVRNTVTQGASPTYVLDMDPAGRGFVLNENTYRYPGPFARDWDDALVDTFDQWRALTGFDAASTASQTPAPG